MTWQELHWRSQGSSGDATIPAHIAHPPASSHAVQIAPFTILRYRSRDSQPFWGAERRLYDIHLGLVVRESLGFGIATGAMLCGQLIARSGWDVVGRSGGWTRDDSSTRNDRGTPSLSVGTRPAADKIGFGAVVAVRAGGCDQADGRRTHSPQPGASSRTATCGEGIQTIGESASEPCEQRTI